MVNAKVKGTNFERLCKKKIQLEEPETEVFRSPASLGSADLIAIRRLYLNEKERRKSDFQQSSWVRLIQCKYLRKYMGKKETDKLINDAMRLGADAFLMCREKPRGKIEYIPLYETF